MERNFEVIQFASGASKALRDRQEVLCVKSNNAVDSHPNFI